MFWLRPHSAEPTRNTTNAPWRTTLRPTMSPSFPASGVEIVDVNRYAVTTHESFAIPPRSPAIVGSAVETIVESSDASSITSISAPKIGPTRASTRSDVEAAELTRRPYVACATR